MVLLSLLQLVSLTLLLVIKLLFSYGVYVTYPIWLSRLPLCGVGFRTLLNNQGQGFKHQNDMLVDSCSTQYVIIHVKVTLVVWLDHNTS